MFLGIVTIACDRSGRYTKQCTNEDYSGCIDQIETGANKALPLSACDGLEVAASVEPGSFNKVRTIPCTEQGSDQGLY